jgi:protein-glutamine gamma-glutamyltransferase
MTPAAASKPVPEKPLLAMCACLVLGALPIAGRVPLFSIAFFLVAVVARLAMQHWRLRLPGVPFRLMVLCVGLGGAIVSTGTLLGIEATLGSLLILVALKLFETRTVRDFQFLGLVGWFLGLCGLFFAQDLVRWLFIGSLFVLIGLTLVQFHRGPGRGTVWRSTRLMATIGLQAFPIIALIFFLFPRSYGGFRFALGRSLQDGTGISDTLGPGSVASIAVNQAIAFRVDFPDGIVPPQSQMYWRGAVLWRGDGFNWSRVPGLLPELKRVEFDGPAIRQRFMIEPHGGRWLFALDRPATVPGVAFYEAGGALRSHKPVHITLRYEVKSHPGNREPDLLPQHHEEALGLPSQVTPEVKALVASWRAGAANGREVVKNALRWFRTENFTYTLSPGIYDEAGALDEFLFRRRAGFCEHYAGAFASLMRVARIPSRVVVGYHGGEFNRLGQYVIVRQSEAHAWSEVWIKGEGWMRVDPTEVIAPDRLTLGLDSLLQTAGGTGGGTDASAGSLSLRGLMRDLRFAWDNLNYQWDLRIVGFDEESQRELFTGIGLPHRHSILHVAWGLIILAPFVGGLALWLRRPTPARAEPVVAAWAALCRTLASAGVARAPSEGPRTFGERVAAALPHRAGEIRALTALYIDARYGRATGPPAEFIRGVRTFRRGFVSGPARATTATTAR